MNALDMIFLAIGGFCVVRGFFRGIFKEVISIIGVLAGFYASCTYYSFLAQRLSRFIANESYLNVISFLIAFFVIYLALTFVGVVLKHLIKAAKLGWAERLLGASCGALKAFLIISALLVALATFLPKNAAVIKNSLFTPHVTIASETMVLVVPKAMKERFVHNIEALKASWKKS